MARKSNSTTPHRRSREELVIDAFRYMIRNGEAVRKEVEFFNRFGGVETKLIYKVEPNKR
ncbi:MAG: hypothetical protein IJT48_13565 [Bacteroidaceae bacterium]|nr:hypothetical protein [Bacteroidaceae bacterium]